MFFFMCMCVYMCCFILFFTLYFQSAEFRYNFFLYRKFQFYLQRTCSQKKFKIEKKLCSKDHRDKKKGGGRRRQPSFEHPFSAISEDPRHQTREFVEVLSLRTQNAFRYTPHFLFLFSIYFFLLLVSLLRPFFNCICFHPSIMFMNSVAFFYHCFAFFSYLITCIPIQATRLFPPFIDVNDDMVSHYKCSSIMNGC